MSSGGDKSGAVLRQANMLSSAIRARRYMISIAATAILIVTAIGWLWIDRETPPAVLSVGAGPYRSDSYELIKEVAEVIDRHSTTIRLKVVRTTDSSRNISLLNNGDVDLATIRSDTPVVSDIRLVADLFRDYFQVLVYPESNIRRITDLTGKRIAIPAFGTDEFRSFWVISDHYDLPITGMDWHAMPFEKAADMLLAGRIDAMFTVRSLRDRMLLDLFEDSTLKDIPLRFLEIDQAEAITVKRPFLSAGKVPKGTYGGDSPTPDRDKLAPVVHRILVARAEIDPAAIAEVTRIMFEHRLDLTIRFALASEISQPDLARGLSVPLHAGAAQFYGRDEPNFLQENAEPLALMVTVLAMALSGLLALRSRFISRQKNRMDSYNYALLDIAEKARGAGSATAMAGLKSEMFALLETVVHALDTDDVTTDGFHSFSRLWEAVREIVNDRQRELLSLQSSKKGKPE